ncbi:MAG: hypothetical protein HC923_04655 [Myxococcales bacterium]|nr:hypothetical protein [Myxococcales bacterium]
MLRAPNVVDLRGSNSSCTTHRTQIVLLGADPTAQTIQSIELAGDTTAFAITPPDQPPFILNARTGRRVIDVEFDPARAAGRDRTASVVIRVSGLSQPFIVPIIGRAAPEGRHADSFVQAGASQVDLLFVLPFHIDQNASTDVDALLTAVSQQYDALIAPIVARGQTFHIGVITGQQEPAFGGTCAELTPSPTADNHNGGCGLLANGPVAGQYADRWRVIDGSETNPSAKTGFASMIARTFGFEANVFATPVIQQATFALHPISVSDWNREIHRMPSHMHVVFVNNLDDSTFLDDGIAYFLESLRYARGQPRRLDLTASALVNPGSTACSTSQPYGSVEPATRIMELVRGLGGSRDLDICAIDDPAVDWPALMTDVGRAASGVRQRVPLSRSPVETSIEVRADGISIAPGASGEGFTYDAIENVLTLNDERALMPGAEVLIDYVPACDL